MNFLSRDVVFLFPNNRSDLDLFFKNLIEASPKNIIFKDLPSNILATLNIEISGDTCNSLNEFTFKFEGKQTIPYMDLLNTLTKIADFHGLDARFDKKLNYKFVQIPILAQAMLRQFTGFLDSGHNYLLE